MRVLVTGGAGFIGSHVIDALLADGHQVLAVDCMLESVHDGRRRTIDPKADLVEADLRDARALASVVKGVDAVSHHAAMVGLEPSFEDARRYVEHNDVGTVSLLQALAEADFSGRFVLASSMVVYGEGAYTCHQHGRIEASERRAVDLDAGRFEPTCPICGGPLVPHPVEEDSPMNPRNVYAATKVHQEHLARAFERARGVPVTTLRYHNVYGARMPLNTPYAGVASIFRSALARGEAPNVFEDGNQMRDFVTVEDVARANVMALAATEPPAGEFNISSGRASSVRRMADLLAASMGGPAPVVTGRWRRGDVRHVLGSPERARRAFGWRARVSIEEGVGRFASAPREASSNRA
jgi:dTDP-L-rhamnose 4-epimerase